MNFRRVRALSKKEFIQIIRDPRSLSLAILIPILLLILFGFALTLDVDNVPLVIWNQDNSQVSEDFLLNFKNSRYFKIAGYRNNYNDLQELLNENKAMMAMIIPRDFAQYLRSGRAAPLQLLVDGSDSNTATIAIGYVRSVVSRYNMKLVIDTFAREGITISAPLDLRPRVWFNPNLLSKYFIIPGLISIIIMIIAALLTSLTFAREWERGTMEQLISTPVKPRELILGKFLPYFALGFLDLLIALIMSKFLFKVPLRGNLILLFALSSIFLTGALTLGMLISIITKNQLMAIQLSILATFIPTFLLSGFMYPIYNMPVVIQAITQLIPARYFIVIMREIYLKGSGLRVLWDESLFLLLFAFIVVTLAVKKIKKKIA